MARRCPKCLTKIEHAYRVTQQLAEGSDWPVRVYDGGGYGGVIQYGENPRFVFVEEYKCPECGYRFKHEFPKYPHI